ncbi:hypothetical protein STSP_24950 [Streptomyces jeddahensis]|uniref:Uncharacterized protein n=1 Tax=Streptomyces jeddahensis TaxID=1716141 RepID=A0A177HU44_9ACTN|nr:hypothetical protein STSP_24950 [Streptomyces jeddahensis]
MTVHLGRRLYAVRSPLAFRPDFVVHSSATYPKYPLISASRHSPQARLNTPARLSPASRSASMRAARPWTTAKRLLLLLPLPVPTPARKAIRALRSPR